MLRCLLRIAACLPVLAAPAGAATSRHHRHPRHVAPAAPVADAPLPPGNGLGALPLIGPLVADLPLAPETGRPIPPEAARFMGYPYDVPGYRYQGYDSCLLRVGGPFGPGPSAGPCPFGLDRAF